jgi:hypothetical protein
MYNLQLQLFSTRNTQHSKRRDKLFVQPSIGILPEVFFAVRANGIVKIVDRAAGGAFYLRDQQTLFSARGTVRYALRHQPAAFAALHGNGGAGLCFSGGSVGFCLFGSGPP